jgi:hypothetical protein
MPPNRRPALAAREEKISPAQAVPKPLVLGIDVPTLHTIETHNFKFVVFLKKLL